MDLLVSRHKQRQTYIPSFPKAAVDPVSRWLRRHQELQLWRECQCSTIRLLLELADTGNILISAAAEECRWVGIDGRERRLLLRIVHRAGRPCRAEACQARARF